MTWRYAAIASVKHALRRILGAFGYEVHRLPRVDAGDRQFSTFDEQAIIRRYLGMLQPALPWAVDIGAGDGRTASNTFALFLAGWRGLAVEADPQRFAQLAAAYQHLKRVALVRCRVTPDNVCGLLRSHGVPRDFTLLSLDIDSYDYFVLERLLAEFRPLLLCAEINETIPPPVRFAVKWDPDFHPTGDHFYGQSLSQLAALGDRHGYALAELHYVNAFLIRRDACPAPALTPDDAYRRGYADRGDRLEKLPWNADMEPLQQMTASEAMRDISRRFKQYDGKFVCSL